MSRFYGDLQGSRGPATRCGDRTSGIHAHLRGWDLGVRVTVREAGSDLSIGDFDVVDIYLTGGSNGSTSDVFLGTYKRGPNGFERLYMGEDVPYVYKAGEE